MGFHMSLGEYCDTGEVAASKWQEEYAQETPAGNSKLLGMLCVLCVRQILLQ